MKKRKTFALIAIIAVLSLTACGGEDSVDYNNDYNLEANTANDNQHGCVEAYYTNENEIEYDENYSYTVESEEPIVEEISPEVPPIAEETHAVESPPTQQSTPPQQNYAPPPAPNPPPAVQPPTIAQQPAPPVIPSPPVIEPPAPPSPTYVPTPPVYVPAPPPPPPPPTNTNPTSNPLNDTWARAIMDAVNVERANLGIAPLVWCNHLARVSLDHAIDAHTNGLAHIGSDGRSPAERAGRGAGEVMGGMPTRNPDPSRPVNSWMNSHGHQGIIISHNFTTAGVGICPNGTVVMKLSTTCC